MPPVSGSYARSRLQQVPAGGIKGFPRCTFTPVRRPHAIQVQHSTIKLIPKDDAQ